MLISQQISQNTHDAYGPQLYQRRDQRGNVWWDIHNPMTGRTTCVDTEEEARLYLEKRMYR